VLIDVGCKDREDITCKNIGSLGERALCYVRCDVINPGEFILQIAITSCAVICMVILITHRNCWCGYGKIFVGFKVRTVQLAYQLMLLEALYRKINH